MKKHSLLVVDNELEVCEILAEYFSEQDFHVASAGDANTAREVFWRRVIDVAIVDNRMLGEDGMSLARWIREHHSQVSIIILTTAAEIIDRAIGLEMLVFGSSYQDLGNGLQGGADLFVAEMGLPDGELHWIKQFGSINIDWAAALVIHDGQLYTISEVMPEDFTAWDVRMIRLSLLTGELMAEETLYQGAAGAIKAVTVVGNQLVVAGAVKTELLDIRGWLRTMPLATSGQVVP